MLSENCKAETLPNHCVGSYKKALNVPLEAETVSLHSAFVVFWLQSTSQRKHIWTAVLEIQ
jgi:hypothetical protein